MIGSYYQTGGFGLQNGRLKAFGKRLVLQRTHDIADVAAGARPLVRTAVTPLSVVIGWLYSVQRIRTRAFGDIYMRQTGHWLYRMKHRNVHHSFLDISNLH